MSRIDTPKPSSPKTAPPKTARAGANFQALFGTSAGDGLLSGLKLVALDRISTGEQPRTKFPDAEIQELADSISQLRERGEGVEGTGILQPLLVTRAHDDAAPYRLIAGERRLRASRKAGLSEVPVIEIKSDTLAEGGVDSRESNLLTVQLVENLQRRDLPALDEARAFKEMMDLRGLSQREAAQILGKSRGYLQNRLDLLQMGEDVQQMVDSRGSTLRVAAHIHRVSNPTLRAELIKKVLGENWSEREVLRYIEEGKNLDSRESRANQIERTDDADAKIGEVEITLDSKSAMDSRESTPRNLSKSLATTTEEIRAAIEKMEINWTEAEKKKTLRALSKMESMLALLRKKLDSSAP